MFTLNISKRDAKENTKELRVGGKIPAVVYGRKTPAMSISLARLPFEKVWKSAGESSVITLEMEGENDRTVLIQDIARDALTELPIHIDFYVVEKDKKVSVDVPIVFVGESPAVKNLGGVLVKVAHELEVEGFPQDLPHEITVDISSLEIINSHITVRAIVLPKEVSIKSALDSIVVTVAAPKEEKEEEAAPIDLSTIEVEKKGKKEEEGAIPEEEPTKKK